MSIKRLTIWQRQHRAQVDAARVRAQRCDAQIQALHAERAALDTLPLPTTTPSRPARQGLDQALARGAQHHRRVALDAIDARLETLLCARADALTDLQRAAARLEASSQALHQARQQRTRRLSTLRDMEDAAS